MQGIEVKEFNVSVERVKALTEKQRYTYYLLGFIYNELMCLRKLIVYTIQQHEDHRPIRQNPELAQTLMLFRMSCAKAWEAHLRLNSEDVSHVLSADVFSIWTGGAGQLKELNKSIAKAKWLNAMRNRLGVHYPTLSEWRPFITPQENWVDDAIFVGEETGNVFYDASEMVVRHHMFMGLQEPTSSSAFHGLMEQMINLLGSITSFVEEALGTFIAANLLDTLPAGPPHRVFAPDFTSIRIPFWTHMDKAKKRKAERILKRSRDSKTR